MRGVSSVSSRQLISRPGEISLSRARRAIGRVNSHNAELPVLQAGNSFRLPKCILDVFGPDHDRVAWSSEHARFGAVAVKHDAVLASLIARRHSCLWDQTREQFIARERWHT